MTLTITCRQCGRQGSRGYQPVHGCPYPDWALCSNASACNRRLDEKIRRLLWSVEQLNAAYAQYVEEEERRRGDDDDEQ